MGSNNQDFQPTRSEPHVEPRSTSVQDNKQQGKQESYMEPSYREHVSGSLGNARLKKELQRPQPPAAPVPEAPPARQAKPPAKQAGWVYPSNQPNQYYPNGYNHQYYNQPYPGQPQGNPNHNGYPGYPNRAYPYPYNNQNGYYGAYGQPYAQPYGQPYQPYGQSYGQPYGQPYNYYGYYQHYYGQQRPKGSTYQRVIAIIASIFSFLAVIMGLLCLILLILTLFGMSRPNLSSAQIGAAFSGVTLLTALTVSGVGGGGFGLWHSIVALMRRPSIEFKLPSIRLAFPVSPELRERWKSNGAARWQQAMISGNKLLIKIPWFVVFLLLYVGMIAIGLSVRGNNTIAANTWLTVLLIGLAGVLPALAVLTLGAWRVHNPRDEHWPTTWRRLAMALISGATSAILFAMILEAVLEIVVTLGFGHINAFQLSDPNAPLPKDIHAILYMIILLSVIAPFVEEGVKPLAVITMLGRINSAAEAFTMGMACGIGFDLIETSSYIGMGYSNWVDVAIERSSAGLLHSFGAGMTALGWYFITHRKALPKNRVLIAFGCFLYAVLQHATWNASFLFDYLPAPVGNYIQNGVIMIGSYPLPAEMIIYSIETVLMLIFLWFVTGKVRGLSSTNNTNKPEEQSKDKLHQLAGTREPYPQPVR